MLLLGKAHIGEVQSSLWDEENAAACEEQGVAHSSRFVTATKYLLNRLLTYYILESHLLILFNFLFASASCVCVWCARAQSKPLNYAFWAIIPNFSPTGC